MPMSSPFSFRHWWREDRPVYWIRGRSEWGWLGNGWNRLSLGHIAIYFNPRWPLLVCKLIGHRWEWRRPWYEQGAAYARVGDEQRQTLVAVTWVHDESCSRCNAAGRPWPV